MSSMFHFKSYIVFLILLTIPLQVYGAKEAEERVSALELRQVYHRLESAYGISRVQSKTSLGSQTLQNFLFSGDVAMTPEVSLTGRLPFVSLAGQMALTNPSLGLKGVLYEGLLKGFPTFVFLDSSLKPPLSGDQEFVFRRTDISVGVSTLREVYHLSLRSNLNYFLKLDPEDATEKYGNELSTEVDGELNTGYQFSLGLNLNYRRAGSLRTSTTTVPGHSLFILKPHFTYHVAPDMTFQGALATPVAARLNESLRVFGDYTIPGVGGNTFFLTFEKKF